MIINYQQLVEAMNKYPELEMGVPATQSLGVNFKADKLKTEKSINYKTVNGRMLIIDFDANGEVYSIEIH
jgi:hypothetical protein